MKLQRSKKYRSALSAASFLVAAASFIVPASAGTSNANLTVSASVSANCTISTDAVAFGAYDPIVANAAAALEGTGTVTVTCTNGSATKVTLGQGANADAGSTDEVPLRRMASGGDHLAYFLYSDVARTTVWGNTEGSGVDHEGTGNAVNLTVYGSITAGQNVPAGNYSDTVVATVTF